jgi:anoctamin-10
MIMSRRSTSILAILNCLKLKFSTVGEDIEVHMFGPQRFSGDQLGLSRWVTLSITFLSSEHIFMGFRAAVRFALSRIGSEQTQKERAERYARRKKKLDKLEAAAENKSHLSVTER